MIKGTTKIGNLNQKYDSPVIKSSENETEIIVSKSGIIIRTYFKMRSFEINGLLLTETFIIKIKKISNKMIFEYAKGKYVNEKYRNNNTNIISFVYLFIILIILKYTPVIFNLRDNYLISVIILIKDA